MSGCGTVKKEYKNLNKKLTNISKVFIKREFKQKQIIETYTSEMGVLQFCEYKDNMFNSESTKVKSKT